MKPVLSVVVPVYNEEEVLAESYRRLTAAIAAIGEPYELIFINDGSRDKTPAILSALCESDSHVRVLDFSRNFGHQPAITAGMDYAQGNAIVVIDADLQDPPEVIAKMFAKWREGFDVVYGKRLKRDGESLFKKLSAKIYYRLLYSMTSVEMPVDTGDFRLIDRKVCDAMKSLGERNRYVRGLVSWVGFKQTAVEFNREKRFAGETKYPLKRMIKLAMDGIMSFSYKPLKFASGIGVTMSLFSFIYLIVIICQKLFTATTVQGWASTTAILVFTQGIVLMMLGIIGEYMGRIFDEIKGRPIYIVREAMGYPTETKEGESNA